MLNNEFPPLGGGTGTVNHAILARLAQAPWLQVDLITSALGKRAESAQFAERVRIVKVPVNNQNIHHSSNRELTTYAARALMLAFRLHRAAPYDLCFAWSAVPAGGVALALRRLTGLHYIVRVCGPDIPGFEVRYSRLYPFLRPMVRAIWRGAETVVAKCEGEAQMIRAVDATARISLVPNGVDLDAFRRREPEDASPERGESGSASGSDDNGPLRLLCVGRLIERKGQRHLIEAVKRLSDQGIVLTLELVGAGDADVAYKALVQQLGLEDRIRFAGYVPRERIARHYAAAHVFVMPSYNEGMSVATLEAMAAGLPVVVTCTGGTAELVEEGVNGFTFDWGNVDLLVSHLRRLAADRGRVRAMGQASQARAASFTWEAATRSYQELFAALAPTGTRQGPGREGLT